MSKNYLGHGGGGVKIELSGGRGCREALTKMSRFAGDLCLKLRRSDIIEAGGIRISRESSRSEPPFWIMIILRMKD